jgi:hypothetical protein
MKTFAEWLAVEARAPKNELLQYAPNKKYFTISPQWHDFSIWFEKQPPSDAELRMMAEIISGHGFPTRVAKTGEQWPYSGDRRYDDLADEIRHKWDVAVDDAVEGVRKYRAVVGRKISHGTHHDGGERMPFYNDQIATIVHNLRYVKDDPEKAKKMFDAMDRNTKFILVHDAGMFTSDGALTPVASQYLRGY